jgi:spermidine synthase
MFGVQSSTFASLRPPAGLRLRVLLAAAAQFRRRPDLWVGTFVLATVAMILATTSISLRSPLRTTYNHLSDSFVVGFITVVFALFTEKLLRAAPPRPRRALRFAWLGSIAAATAGLLATYARVNASSTGWILQALVLAVIALSSLVAVLLPAAGFVRWRDLGAAAHAVTRQWCAVFLSILGGGYLLTAIYRFSPAVIDPILLRMDLSLGFHAAEIIGPWVADTTWVRVATNYGYPLLGFFLAAVAGCLHLAGATAALRRCLLAILLVTLFGKVGYWCAPGIGPCYAYPELVAGPAKFATGQAGLDALRAAAVAGPDRPVLDPDVARNAMPSLHTAFTLVALAAAWSHRRRLFWWWLPLGFVQIATTLTLSVHYVVDLIAAVPLAVLCWSLANAGVRRFPPSDAAPLPPLAATGRTLQHRALALGLSLATALAALVLWGRFAPLSPWLTWPLVLVIAGLPVWLSARLFAPALNSCSAPSLNAQPFTLNSPAAAPRLLACAVFCTGGTALILEQVSEKYLSTLLGASRPAATIVLAVYFAGLALGAWLCPKRTAGAARRLALLELFIAGWAVLVAVAFFACDRALGAWLATTDTSSLALTATRTAVAILWILPPTLAMGAQLPTLASVLAGLPATPDTTLPRYYALNLAGAFVFTVAAPPLLFNFFGAGGALWAVAALGLFIGVALWSGLPPSKFEVQRSTFEVPPPLTPSPPPTPLSPHSFPLGPWSLNLGPSAAAAAAAAAGFAFFALEVIWFHLIGAVCGASTYTFSILLAAILLALALAGRRTDRSSTSLATVLGALALTLTLSNALWPWAGRLLATLRAALGLESFWSGELLKLAVVTALVLPPAFFLGQIFPRLLRAAADSAHVGRLCTANILGCVAGALTTGFALIPSLGAERTLQLLTLLAATTALLAALLTASRPLTSAFGVRRSTFDVLRPSPSLPFTPSLLLPLTALVLLAVLPRWDRLELTRGFGIYLAPQLSPAARLVSFREDFRAGFVTVTATPSRDPARPAPTLTLLQNGKFDADDAGEVPAQVAFGLIAALHAPAQNRALVIGAGSGQTASIVARLGFAHVDIAELSPAHLAAARAEFSHLNRGVFDRPGVTVHVEDGRNHLLRTRARFDAIQIELTSVWFAGATNLYSREFYALARERLAPGGVLVQWVQLHHITPREIATILATARAEFPAVSLWRAGHQACLIGFTAAPRLNPDVWSLWRTSPDLATERTLPALDTPDAFLSHQLLPIERVDALLTRYAAHVGLNTDRNRWLEFQTPKYSLSRRDHRTENLRWLTSK